MKYFKIFAVIMIASTLLLSPVFVGAQDLEKSIGDSLQNLGEGAGLKDYESEGGLPKLVGTIINIFLSIIGVFFVVLIIYGGYTWMSSFGNKEKVDKAKTVIVDAVIGLIILLAAYAISNFVVTNLIEATVR
ncbi:hypothetical protein ACFL29_01780 [Patescibacteria group bacterium]